MDHRQSQSTIGQNGTDSDRNINKTGRKEGGVIVIVSKVYNIHILPI